MVVLPAPCCPLMERKCSSMHPIIAGYTLRVAKYSESVNLRLKRGVMHGGSGGDRDRSGVRTAVLVMLALLLTLPFAAGCGASQSTTQTGEEQQVEGGAGVITSLLRQNLADKVIIAIAPKIMGKGIEAVGELNIREVNQTLALSFHKIYRMGEDLVVEARVGSA